jgi:hypothetical protein
MYMRMYKINNVQIYFAAAGFQRGRSPLLWSLLGLKRTCRFAPHMSAYDPKRTSVDASSMFAKPIPSLEAIGGEHEAAGIYWSGIRGGGLATHRLWAGENSPDRVSAYRRRRTNGTRF